jgi:hypothetical protein
MTGRCTAAEERAFLESVLYAAVFDYPLTLDQLHEALIGVRATKEDLARWYSESCALQTAIEVGDGYFFPQGRRDLLEVRQAREYISRSALGELRKPLALVLHMPFVRMVAISGSLAHLNASGAADLDLFVITKAHRVWSVTTTLLVLSRLLGWRRKLCLNYVISEAQLAVEPHDLFAANQIVHLRPLSGENVYRRFIAANPFVNTLYPNFVPRTAASSGPPHSSQRTRSAFERILDWTVAPLYERTCRLAYGWYLRRRSSSWQSHDQVRLEPECLKLHTSSHRQRVMEQFEAAVTEAERVTREAALHAPSVP